MDGRIYKLAGTLNDFAAAGIDTDVFGFGIFGAHTTQIGYFQAAVSLDLGNHSAERVTVGFQQ